MVVFATLNALKIMPTVLHYGCKHNHNWRLYMNVAFIGHRKIENSDALRERTKNTVETLIVNEGADTFIFGSKSEFDSLCYDIVTELRNKYKNIKRIYIRADCEYIDEYYLKYLHEYYEETYYPIRVRGAGVLSYIKRNEAIIDMCETLITYYNNAYMPHTKTRSGTGLAVSRAYSMKKRIINMFE